MIEDFYDSSGLVQQVSTTSTNMGGVKQTFGTRIAALPCRVSARNVTEVDQYGKRTTREVWRLYCAASSTNRAIKNSDRITVDSVVYEVIGVRNPALLNHHLELDMLEVA